MCERTECFSAKKIKKIRKKCKKNFFDFLCKKCFRIRLLRVNKIIPVREVAMLFCAIKYYVKYVILAVATRWYRP